MTSNNTNIFIRKINSSSYEVSIWGETIVVSPETILPLDVDALSSLVFKLRGAIAELEHQKTLYEIEKDAKKIEIINEYVKQGTTKTQAEKQVKGDETYINFLKVIAAYQLMIDYLWTMVRYVEGVISRRTNEEK